MPPPKVLVPVQTGFIVPALWQSLVKNTCGIQCSCRNWWIPLGSLHQRSADHVTVYVADYKVLPLHNVLPVCVDSSPSMAVGTNRLNWKDQTNRSLITSRFGATLHKDSVPNVISRPTSPLRLLERKTSCHTRRLQIVANDTHLHNSWKLTNTTTMKGFK